MIYYAEEGVLSISELDSAICFASDNLGLPENISIDIQYIDSESNLWGSCDQEEPNNLEFVIEINKDLTINDMIETLFHELVHVKQIAFKQYNVDKKTWNNIVYYCNYNELPWEIEAFYLQEKLANEYFRK